MIDLFGMGHKDADQPQPEPVKDDAHQAPPEHGGEPQPPRGSHRLWAFLLVLDSIFVIVFGGAVAAKVYQYWKEPAPVPVAARRHPGKPAEAPKPAEPAASTAAVAAKPAPVPAPAKPVEPAKPKEEPKTASRRGESPRPPKPSLLNEAPKPRSTPSPATTAAAPAAPAPAAAPGKALPVVFKLRAPSAGNVQLVGAFIVHGGRKEMTKNSEGVWTVKLYLNAGQYRYFFSVDKKKLLDPENPRSDRGASLLTVP